MLLFSSTRYLNLSPAINLSDIKQIDHTQYTKALNKITLWIHKEWGYIRPALTLEQRTHEIDSYCEQYYIINYGEQTVGVFRLIKTSKDRNAIELYSVYVDDNMRNLGVGRSIVSEAQKIAREQGYKRLVFQTLNPPLLNKFYFKYGAELLGDGYFKVNVPKVDGSPSKQFETHPCDELQIRLSS